MSVMTTRFYLNEHLQINIYGNEHIVPPIFSSRKKLFDSGKYPDPLCECVGTLLLADFEALGIEVGRPDDPAYLTYFHPMLHLAMQVEQQMQAREDSPGSGGWDS